MAIRQGAVESASAPPAMMTSASPVPICRGLEPRAALLIDGRGGNRFGQPGREGDQPRRVATCRAVADNDLVDPVCSQSGILQDREHDGSRQVLDSAVPVQASDATERRSPRRDNVGRTQCASPGHEDFHAAAEWPLYRKLVLAPHEIGKIRPLLPQGGGPYREFSPRGRHNSPSPALRNAGYF